MIRVWVDGSNDNYHTKIAAIGIVAKYKGKTITIGEYIGTGTNNVAELMAIKIALQKLHKRYHDIPVIIYSDSQYAIGAVTGKHKKVKANKELITEVKAEIKRFRSVKIKWVKGHGSCKEHNEADRIARKVFREMKKLHLEQKDIDEHINNHISSIMNEN